MLLVLFVAGCSEEGARDAVPFRYRGLTMGTTFSVTAPAVSDPHRADALKRGIDDTLAAVEAGMSTYLEDSELSRLNRNRSTEWLPVSEELAAVLAEALRISRLTNGAFDVTVGPLVNLWGFGPERRAGERLPDPAQIAQRLARCGYRNLTLKSAPPAVRKRLPELYLDLSALAKGYGVDRVVAFLESQGIGDYLVEIGGELRVRGTSPRGDAWRIGIERPVPGERRVERVLVLNDMAVATSGDYRNYIEVDGHRYSHTIDPRNGRPIDHALASVTVLSHTTMTADALATALMVLGPDDGLRMADKNGWAALFIIKAADGFVERTTEAFSSAAAAP